MTVLVDTREQMALPFGGGVLTRRATLPFGDYAYEMEDGTMPPLFFERKSIPDLFGTLSRGYERFRRMLRKAAEAEVRVVIIVEGSLRKINKGYARSQRTGPSIVRQLFTLRAVYGVDLVFCQDRAEAAAYVVHCFDAYRRMKR